MSLLDAIVFVAIGFVGGAAVAAVIMRDRQPLPQLPPRRLDPFRISRN